MTPLGWTCVGAVSQTDQYDATTNFIRTYFTSKETTVEQVNILLRRFWKIDISGIESLPVMREEERSILERVENSAMFINGHYQVAIPWKENRAQLPNNYKMALQRL